MTYSYRGFGLHIVSDIMLPELITAVGGLLEADVLISKGKVPTHIHKAIERHESYQVGENQFLFAVPGVGRYYVANGNRITVEPIAGEEECAAIRLFLLGTAFGALLMQRGIFPIHGSAVVIRECCVIFAGVSGAGKSTLLAGFRKHGYSFLTDDVAAITIDLDGNIWVTSAYPQQKLWRDSAETIGVDTASLTPFYMGNGKDKFAVPVYKGFCPFPVPLAAVYEIGVERCRDVTMNPVTGMDKLAVLMNHSYRPWLIDGLGLKTAHFQHCAAVARRVAVSHLTRPEGVFSTEEQIRLIQQDVVRLLADRAV